MIHPLPTPDTAAQGLLDGERAANAESLTPVALAAFSAGCILGAPGCGLATLLAFVMEPPMPALEGRSSAYQVAYRSAYKDHLRQRRGIHAALWGVGGVATASAVAFTGLVIFYGGVFFILTQTLSDPASGLRQVVPLRGVTLTAGNLRGLGALFGPTRFALE